MFLRSKRAQEFSHGQDPKRTIINVRSHSLFRGGSSSASDHFLYHDRFNRLDILLSPGCPINTSESSFPTYTDQLSNRSMPTTVNMFWHGSALPPYARCCIQTFIDRGHAVRLFSYNQIDVPRGVINVDAGAVIEARDLECYQSIEAFSDRFRYELLFKQGGWWVDVDVVCLTDRLTDSSHAWAEEEPGVINSAILKFPAGDPAVGRLAKRARELVGHSDRWGATGPQLASEILGPCEPVHRAGSTAEFYPVHWLEAPRLLLPEQASEISHQIKSALFLHLWINVFKDVGVDLNKESPRGSFMYELLKAHSFPVKSTRWTELMLRRAIRKYWRQSWAVDHWTRILAADTTKRRLKVGLLR